MAGGRKEGIYGCGERMSKRASWMGTGKGKADFCFATVVNFLIFFRIDSLGSKTDIKFEV